jgi:hypothetical protein
MALDFLEGAARRRMAAVGPLQARQEALSLASIRAELGSARAIERPSGNLGPTGLGPSAGPPQPDTEHAADQQHPAADKERGAAE